VLPLFYAELTVVLNSLENVTHEIIFVDDGSTDATLQTLKDLAQGDETIQICALARNFGHQVALAAGLDMAECDAVIMMDVDLEHPPALLPEMVEKWRDGYDIVSAVRRDVHQSLWKKTTSRAFYRLVNLLSTTHVPHDVADFCLLSRPVYSELRSMRERHRFVRGMVSWLGFHRAFVHYNVGKRAAGVSKYTGPKMFAMALDAIFSFSSLPLRLATRVGLFITFSGAVYLAWILVRFFLVRDAVPGWASLIGVTLVLGGSQLLFLGLIGEYLARVFEEVKGRPLYVRKWSTNEAKSTEAREKAGDDPS
jgi:dolichol-phosphate mannosyltransferase